MLDLMTNRLRDFDVRILSLTGELQRYIEKGRIPSTVQLSVKEPYPFYTCHLCRASETVLEAEPHHRCQGSV